MSWFDSPSFWGGVGNLPHHIIRISSKTEDGYKIILFVQSKKLLPPFLLRIFSCAHQQNSFRKRIKPTQISHAFIFQLWPGPSKPFQTFKRCFSSVFV